MLGGFKRKTYSDSYLYNKETRKHNEALMGLVLKAERIDKSSEAFKEILYELKKTQRSSILCTVMTLPDVVICYGMSKPMSPAFKVFCAKDLRDGNNAKNKIFIDASEIFVLKSGYFTCKNMSYLISYLFEALIYLIYDKEPSKLVNNSTITISSTECFVAMFDYIIDYLRIIGYAENKEKISYMVALYYLHHMVGKDMDTYTKNIATKIAGITANEAAAFELYFDEDKDFEDIDTFITVLAERFKLKGLTTEVFISKWLYLYKNGTQFGTELYTSFLCILATAYTGSYIVNQKQIERACGSSMVKLGKAILQAGVDVFENKAYMRTAFESMDYISKDTALVTEKVKNRRNTKMPEEAKFTLEDFSSKAKCKKKMSIMIQYYVMTVTRPNNISPKVVTTVRMCCKTLPTVKDQGTYTIGVLETILKAAKGYMNKSDARIINSMLADKEKKLQDAMIRTRDEDKKLSTRCAKVLADIRKCKNIL